MKNEKKVCGILAIIFGVIGVIGSWMPFINNVSFVFGLIGLIFGLIGLVINLKRTKILSIVGALLSIATIIVVLVTQSMYSKAIDDAGKKISTEISSASSSREKESEDKFKWTKESYDALVVGDTLTGAGGQNYNDIVANFGEPSNKSESTANDLTTLNATWDNGSLKKYKSISLNFAKQDDGTYLLSYKFATGLE